MSLKSKHVPLFNEHIKVPERLNFYSGKRYQAVSQPEFKSEGDAVTLFISAEHNCAELYHPIVFKQSN